MSDLYLDQAGKEIHVDDRIHYASKGCIYVGRVVELLPNNKGVKVFGVNKKREAILNKTTEKIIVVQKGYYVKHKRAQRTGRA
jgi:hypothetical protein